MPHPDGAHTHGPSGPRFDWRIAAVIAVVALLASGEATRAVVSGIEALILWLAVVFGVVVVVTAAIVVVTVKRRTPDYVRAIHGVTERDQLTGERAQIQRDAASYRAMRNEIAMRIATEHHFRKMMQSEFPQGTVVRADYTVNTDNPGHEARREGT